MLYECAQVGQELLARHLLLIRGLNRHSSEREAIGARMKEHLGRIPLDRRADLPRIELHVIDSRLLERDCQFESDRSRADDRDVPRLHQAFIPISRRTATFASIMT